MHIWGKGAFQTSQTGFRKSKVTEYNFSSWQHILESHGWVDKFWQPRSGSVSQSVSDASQWVTSDRGSDKTFLWWSGSWRAIVNCCENLYNENIWEWYLMTQMGQFILIWQRAKQNLHTFLVVLSLKSWMSLKKLSVWAELFCKSETRKLIKSRFVCLLTMESGYENLAE